MSKGYKLTYFDARARGEIARLLFAAVGAKYEDKRIQFQDWPAMKATTPLGTLPVLEVDGQTLSQSSAINRFIARKFGLYGKGDWEAAEIDEIVDTCVDLFSEIVKTMFGDDASKAEACTKLKDEHLPRFIGIMDKKAKANGSGFLVGKSLSLADIAVYHNLDTVMKADPDLLDKVPAMKKNKQKVEENKGIKDWLSKRPESAM